MNLTLAEGEPLPQPAPLRMDTLAPLLNKRYMPVLTNEKGARLVESDEKPLPLYDLTNIESVAPFLKDGTPECESLFEDIKKIMPRNYLDEVNTRNKSPAFITEVNSIRDKIREAGKKDPRLAEFSFKNTDMEILAALKIGDPGLNVAAMDFNQFLRFRAIVTKFIIIGREKGIPIVNLKSQTSKVRGFLALLAGRLNEIPQAPQIGALNIDRVTELLSPNVIPLQNDYEDEARGIRRYDTSQALSALAFSTSGVVEPIPTLLEEATVDAGEIFVSARQILEKATAGTLKNENFKFTHEETEILQSLQKGSPGLNIAVLDPNKFLRLRALIYAQAGKSGVVLTSADGNKSNMRAFLSYFAAEAAKRAIVLPQPPPPPLKPAPPPVPTPAPRPVEPAPPPPARREPAARLAPIAAGSTESVPAQLTFAEILAADKKAQIGDHGVVLTPLVVEGVSILQADSSLRRLRQGLDTFRAVSSKAQSSYKENFDDLFKVEGKGNLIAKPEKAVLEDRARSMAIIKLIGAAHMDHDNELTSGVLKKLGKPPLSTANFQSAMQHLRVLVSGKVGSSEIPGENKLFPKSRDDYDIFKRVLTYLQSQPDEDFGVKERIIKGVPDGQSTDAKQNDTLLLGLLIRQIQNIPEARGELKIKDLLTRLSK